MSDKTYAVLVGAVATAASALFVLALGWSRQADVRTATTGGYVLLIFALCLLAYKIMQLRR
jgi:hypothetical protein